MLREHDITELANADQEDAGKRFVPGSAVVHTSARIKSYGIIISLEGSTALVLWSIYDDALERFVFPAIRKVQQRTFPMQNLVSIQPMSLPAGLTFYLDYTYGEQKPSGSVG
jgi:hypothetical protein